MCVNGKTGLKFNQTPGFMAHYIVSQHRCVPGNLWLEYIDNTIAFLFAPSYNHHLYAYAII